jgi:hypothetical protein
MPKSIASPHWFSNARSRDLLSRRRDRAEVELRREREAREERIAGRPCTVGRRIALEDDRIAPRPAADAILRDHLARGCARRPVDRSEAAVGLHGYLDRRARAFDVDEPEDAHRARDRALVSDELRLREPEPLDADVRRLGLRAHDAPAERDHHDGGSETPLSHVACAMQRQCHATKQAVS